MDLVHSAFVPPGDGPFPTLVALHGFGASALDLLGLSRYLAGGKLLTLCPQGAVELRVGAGGVGYSWFPMTPGQPPDARAFLKASTKLREFVEKAPSRYPIDRSRTVALGFSQGGLMAIDLAFRDTEHIAGLVVLSSWFPEILASNLPQTDRQKDLPVLMIHGTEDAQASVEQARASRPIFERFGVDLEYHELPMGHEIRPEALRVLVRWLEKKVLS